MTRRQQQTDDAAEVEQRTIFAAHQYALKNGYPMSDIHRSVGLVLVGMVMAAECSIAAQNAISRRYRAAHPEAAEALSGWVEFISEGDRPAVCRCVHAHSRGSDGEDAGCPCRDGHDFGTWAETAVATIRGRSRSVAPSVAYDEGDEGDL